jgi:hypothetical protein
MGRKKCVEEREWAEAPQEGQRRAEKWNKMKRKQEELER